MRSLEIDTNEPERSLLSLSPGHLIKLGMVVRHPYKTQYDCVIEALNFTWYLAPQSEFVIRAMCRCYCCCSAHLVMLGC